MKVFLIHTYYSKKGGEDAVFKQELSLLEKVTNVNSQSYQNSTGLKGLILFLKSVWNLRVAKDLKERLLSLRPDIIHIHNWHFATGPLVIRVANSLGIKVILTIHNYRLLCPSATLMHNNKLFLNSVNVSFPWKAVRLKVYRNSSLQTFWLSFIIWFHKKIGTWSMVDQYICLTAFSKNLFHNSSFNIAEEKFSIKPNFVKIPEKFDIERQKHFLFVGRLSEEKGLQMLINTFIKTNLIIKIAGEGPLQKYLLEVASTNKNIIYLGALDSESIQIEMQSCTALVFPSIWYEGMPMTILEAFSLGTPVIASNIGAMATMITPNFNGLHFEVNNEKDLLEKITYWNFLPQITQDVYYSNSYSTFLENYTPEINLQKLLEVYVKVLKVDR
ncbi:glycosyltransferase family 4 protein [Dyadobacter sp. 3J3]|uniref:glycosyltransferase family 4 protein n=1 Tax=Dyadobacter sp. 3J3 TaxID=2606600 RepID=UPI00135799EE|nr:glycosyltransferase family 4 protein [Dyadobacter sp. 3J3]